MGFFELIRDAEWRTWRIAIVWLVLVVFAGVMPIGGSYLFIQSIGESPSLRDPLRHGELALISISLLAGAAFVIARGIRIDGVPMADDDESGGIDQLSRILQSINFPGLLGLVPTIFILAVGSAFLFAIAISADFMGVTDLRLIDARIIFSAILLFISLLTAFLITAVETSFDYSRHDLRAMAGDDFTRWQQNVDSNWTELD